MIIRVIDFFKYDFWNFMWSLPKCKSGGYCNQDREHYYINKIGADEKNVIVSGYRYYCTKCGKETSEYGKI